MLDSKKNKLAVVTGARQGLGKAFAMRMAEEGATVIAVDRDDAPSLVDELTMAGAEAAEFHRLDVSNEDQVRDFASKLLATHGKCDILVNNAGMNRHVMFKDISAADWRAMMTTNVDSMFYMCSALVPSMTERKWGRVVNVTSDTYTLSIPGFTHYMASKGAVIGFTRGLSNDVGMDGVTVNCIAPGLTRTPHTEKVSPDGALFDRVMQMQAIKRHGVPEDLASALSFLTSEGASYMTGQTITVNGGLTKTL